MDLVSIIMPAYNVEDYISSSINSVISQTYYQWELIIIDDGSYDNTHNIAREFEKKDFRIRVFKQVNRGVSSARNLGISLAQGVYITFLDSDDLYDPHFLEKMVSPLKKYGYNVSFCKYQLKRPNGDICYHTLSKVTSLKYNSFIDHVNSTKNAYVGMGFLYRLSFIKRENLLFNEQTTNFEDIEFLLKACFQTEVYFVSDPLYIYIDRPNSASKSFIDKRQIQTVLTCFLRLEKFFQNSSSQEASKYLEHISNLRSDYNNNVKRFLWKQIKHGNFDTVREIVSTYNSLNQKISIKSKGHKIIGDTIKIRIIFSENIYLWRLISLFTL